MNFLPMLNYAVSFTFMQECSKALFQSMRDKGLSQAQLAKNAKVSQSTISRALRGETKRHSQARHRLFAHLGITGITPLALR